VEGACLSLGLIPAMLVVAVFLIRGHREEPYTSTSTVGWAIFNVFPMPVTCMAPAGCWVSTLSCPDQKLGS
jgi:hypothetical protein